jgi:hypothetical protein
LIAHGATEIMDVMAGKISEHTSGWYVILFKKNFLITDFFLKMKVGGVPTEEDYGGYLGQDGYCHIDNVTLVAPIKGFVNVTSNK